MPLGLIIPLLGCQLREGAESRAAGQRDNPRTYNNSWRTEDPNNHLLSERTFTLCARHWTRSKPSLSAPFPLYRPERWAGLASGRGPPRRRGEGPGAPQGPGPPSRAPPVAHLDLGKSRLTFPTGPHRLGRPAQLARGLPPLPAPPGGPLGVFLLWLHEAAEKDGLALREPDAWMPWAASREERAAAAASRTYSLRQVLPSVPRSLSPAAQSEGAHELAGFAAENTAPPPAQRL